MLQFGLRAHDFGTLPLERLAETLSRFSPASIQLALSKALTDSPSPSGSLSPAYARRVRATFAKRDIAISVLGCYINPVHPERDKREASLRKFEEHLRFARDFGCAIVGTETGSRNGDCSFHPDTRTDDTFDLLCESVARLTRTAERCGSIVGIEPVADTHTVDSIEKTAELIRRIHSPALGIIWDPVNLIPAAGLESAGFELTGLKPAELTSQEAFFTRALDAFADRIVVVHAKDYCMKNGKKSGPMPAGKGELDWNSLFTLLQNRKPWIDVLLENASPENALETIAFARKTEASTCP
jgi:sugar phosphate isomerase/epimerase